MLSIHGCIQVYIMSPKKGIYLHIYSHMCMYPYRQMCVCIRYVIRNKNAICVCVQVNVHTQYTQHSIKFLGSALVAPSPFRYGPNVGTNFVCVNEFHSPTADFWADRNCWRQKSA